MPKRILDLANPNATYKVAKTSAMTQQAQLQLAAKLKEGDRCPAGIRQLFSHPENLEQFFNHSMVQRELVEGLMMGSITNDAIIAEMKKCLPCIEPDAQTQLVADQWDRMLETLGGQPEIAFVMRFFTDPAAQTNFAWGATNGDFIEHPTMLDAMLENLPIFTAPSSQEAIAQAILVGQFDEYPEMPEILAENLPMFTNLRAQQYIAQAIAEKRFDGSSATLAALAKIGVMEYSNAVIKRVISLDLPLKEKNLILRERKSATLWLECVKNSQHPQIFGTMKYSCNKAISILQNAYLPVELPNVNPRAVHGLHPCAIEDFLESEHDYALQIYEKLAIVYPLKTENDISDFKGWINSRYAFFYKHCLANVKVYDFSKLSGGYPSMISGSDLSTSHTQFENLPGYLKCAIRMCQFHATDFQQEAMIEFVTATILKPLIEHDLNLGKKMQAILQSSIGMGGAGVKIAETSQEDAVIKNDINDLCGEVQHRGVDFSGMVAKFFNQLPTVQEKAMLAFLLGSMAQSEILGYGHEATGNQANDLFYTVSKECFTKLANVAGITLPDNFIQELNGGVCIGALMKSFSDYNPFVKAVFAKN